jgi:hypothetical protein
VQSSAVFIKGDGKDDGDEQRGTDQGLKRSYYSTIGKSDDFDSENPVSQ